MSTLTSVCHIRFLKLFGEKVIGKMIVNASNPAGINF